MMSDEKPTFLNTTSERPEIPPRSTYRDARKWNWPIMPNGWAWCCGIRWHDVSYETAKANLDRYNFCIHCGHFIDRLRSPHYQFDHHPNWKAFQSWANGGHFGFDEVPYWRDLVPDWKQVQLRYWRKGY